MSLTTKFKNLSSVAKRLKRGKLKRVKAILRDYGLREFLRRVNEKMELGDSAIRLRQRFYVITNESFLRKGASLAPFRMEPRVSFRVAPGAKNVGKVEIMTSNPNHVEGATLKLEIYENGTLLATATSESITDGGYTEISFLPVLNVLFKPLDFVVTSSTPFCGILVDRKHSCRGFEVESGGRIVCKVYTQLDEQYVYWLKNNVLSEEELQKQRDHAFSNAPKISVIVPLYNTPECLFRAMVDSVVAQTYPGWELCLADGSTEPNNLEHIVKEYYDERILYKKLDANEGIAGNSNRAIEMAAGDYIALLDHDDTLTPQALYRNVALINEDADYDFIYSDEDKVTEDGSHRFDPFFKPDFSPDMLYAFNYITHFTVIKKTLLDEVGHFRDEFNGAQDYDLFLRATEKAKKIGHIPDVLYNWRIAETSTAYSSDTKSYTVAAGKAALEASIARRGLRARVLPGALPNYYNVAYDLPAPPPGISIIIPNKDERKTLKKCLDSILRKSTYANYEIIVVENNSTEKATFAYYKKIERDPRVRVITYNEPFNFARINNFAAERAKYPILLFMNNDMTVISPDWLEQMAMHAQRPEIGAVGAKLYYPDDSLQHGGIVLRIGGIAGHSHKYTDRDEVGSFARLMLVHNVSAVTGACVMTRADVFNDVGGFDEQFVLAFNDVDLCLKIREHGYRIVWTPYAELYHFESKTRGYEVTPEKIERFENEQRKWSAKWADKYPVDPYYNPNLTHVLEDYSVDPGKTGASLREVTSVEIAENVRDAHANRGA